MSDSDIASIYSAPQQGGELPYFVGKQYGDGGGWLGNFKKMAFPIMTKIKNYGKDLISDPEFKKAVKHKIIEGATGLVDKITEAATNSSAPTNTSVTADVGDDEDETAIRTKRRKRI